MDSNQQIEHRPAPADSNYTEAFSQTSHMQLTPVKQFSIMQENSMNHVLRRGSHGMSMWIHMPQWSVLGHWDSRAWLHWVCYIHSISQVSVDLFRHHIIISRFICPSYQLIRTSFFHLRVSDQHYTDISKAGATTMHSGCRCNVCLDCICFPWRWSPNARALVIDAVISGAGYSDSFSSGWTQQAWGAKDRCFLVTSLKGPHSRRMGI